MRRYIDADKFMKVLEEDIPITDNPVEVMASVIAALESQPTTDVVEIVRCKDCKRHIENDVGDIFCNYHGISMLENDFCSYGEKAKE